MDQFRNSNRFSKIHIYSLFDEKYVMLFYYYEWLYNILCMMKWMVWTKKLRTACITYLADNKRGRRRYWYKNDTPVMCL